MESPGQRIRKRRNALKLTQKDVASAVHVSSPSVTQCESDLSLPKSDNAKALCDVLMTNWQWIRYGTGSPDDIEPPLQANTKPATTRGLCPLISKVQAGAWTETVDVHEAGYAEDWMPCPVKHGKHTYILQVEGESMYSPSGNKSFKSGDYIFVDPEKLPENGSLVIAKNDEDDAATFKQLIIDGDKRYLKALNRDWPDRIIKINENTRICGVVICKLEQY